MQQFSLSVKALNSAPMESNSTAISLKPLFAVPLNKRCSIRWETPLIFSFSFLEPAGSQKPNDIDLKCGIYSLTTRIPLSNSVISYLSNFKLLDETIFPFTSLIKCSDICSFQTYFFSSGIYITDFDQYFITYLQIIINVFNPFIRNL